MCDDDIDQGVSRVQEDGHDENEEKKVNKYMNRKLN